MLFLLKIEPRKVLVASSHFFGENSVNGMGVSKWVKYVRHTGTRELPASTASLPTFHAV
jgi:hypothetical protein